MYFIIRLFNMKNVINVLKEATGVRTKNILMCQYVYTIKNLGFLSLWYLKNKIPVKFEGIGTVSMCCFFLQVAR